MLDKWIDKQLKKDGFMRVPISWREDYKSLVEKKQTTDKMIREIGREYNNLLKEKKKKKSISWLKDALTEVGISFDKGVSKEDLINLYVNAYMVNFEDDIEEEVK